MSFWDGRLIILLVVLLLAAAGFAKIAFGIKKYTKSFNIVGQYRQKFHEYVKNLREHGDSSAEYNYLVRHSAVVQRLLGGFGMISSFRPPYGQVIYKQYPVILNAIPEIDSLAHNHPLSGFRGTSDMSDGYVRIVDDCLVRYGGASEGHLQDMEAKLKNPIIWISEGIKTLILPVLYLPMWFGVLSSSKVEAASNSFIVKLGAFIIFIVGGVSSLFAVVLGWDQFVEKLKHVEWLANFLGLK